MDDIKIELTSYTTGPQDTRWVAKSLGLAEFEIHAFNLDRGSYVQVDIHMTNKRGTEYRATITRTYNGCSVRHVFNIPNDRYYRITDAPKWVQKTIEEQLPVVAIMLS